jgi:hypothetical protein
MNRTSNSSSKQQPTSTSGTTRVVSSQDKTKPSNSTSEKNSKVQDSKSKITFI